MRLAVVVGGCIAFDTLIGGNRQASGQLGIHHQPWYGKMRFAPLFDNGTSLGHERFPDKFLAWHAADYERYIAGYASGKMVAVEPVRGHFELLETCGSGVAGDPENSAPAFEFDIRLYLMAVTDLMGLDRR